MINILKNSAKYDIPSAMAVNLKSLVMIFNLMSKLSNNINKETKKRLLLLTYN